jgi:DNA-binding CsgD family transcriptional regulator
MRQALLDLEMHRTTCEPCTAYQLCDHGRNILERAIEGAQARGLRRKHPKKADAEMIAKILASRGTATQEQLADQFNLSQGTISRIMRGVY